jgi:hypothetical protein
VRKPYPEWRPPGPFYPQFSDEEFGPVGFYVEMTQERAEAHRRRGEILEPYNTPLRDRLADHCKALRKRNRIDRRLVLLESYLGRPEEPQPRRGRPVTMRPTALAALEAQLANPNARWQELERKYLAGDLRRGVRRIKELLKQENIPLPEPSAYGVIVVIIAAK